MVSKREKAAKTIHKSIFHTTLKPYGNEGGQKSMRYQHLSSPYFSIESRKYEDENHLLIMAKAFGIDLEQKDQKGGLVDMLYIELDKRSRNAHFGPKGNIMMTYEGIGLGSALSKALLMDMQTYKRQFSGVSFSKISLSGVDAYSEKINKDYSDNEGKHQNFARRSRFYEKLGFHVDVDDDGNGSGKIENFESLVSAEDYKLVEGTSFIEPKGLVESGLEKDKKIEELSRKLEDHKDSLDFYKKENQTLYNYKILVIVVGVIGVLALVSFFS